MSDIPEKDLLELLRSDDSFNYGFNLLVRKYQQQVYWQVRRMVIIHEDADDLVQEIFVKIWKNIDSFRGKSKLTTWIYRIAVNETISFLKSKRNRLFLPLVDYEKQLAQSLKDDRYFSGDTIQLYLQKALLRLPEKQRLVFNLRYYSELQYDEISEITGTSVGALKASYHHAVKKIEKYLSEN
ncbi:MAG: RNA polymerase sigma factor [Lentimicrobiaceae bacterium]|nr:RNA polymerase sigma factor [Lentimicrobiaceae bacterium]